MVTTYVRSIFGLPVLLIYLIAVMVAGDYGLPDINASFLIYSLGAALSQVAATALLIYLFTLRNFAVGTTLTKTDVMMTAILGSILFSETISTAGWVAILLTVAGVILLSIARTGVSALSGGGQGLLAAVLAKPNQIGILTGFFFCLSYLFLREASLSLSGGGFLYTAAWTVVTVTAMQVIFLGLWLAIKEPSGFRQLGLNTKLCLFIGLTSALGSIGWFTAMTIENASYVKSVGQVETIFTMLISSLYVREKIAGKEMFGIVLIVAGVLVFLF